MIIIKLLLAEDEKRMAEALREIFRQEGYDVDIAEDGEAALKAVRSGIYDIIVMDVMLPKMNGFAVTAKIREDRIKTPILILTAKDDLDDKVMGLDSGADDYLTKPFMTKELLARMRALTRRNTSYQDNSLSYGDILLSPSAAELTCQTTGQSVKLSEKEYRILEYLIINQGRILSREQLAVKIWGYDCAAEYNNVEVYMSFTRRKLSFVGARVEIKAVRRLGYELRYPDVP